MADELVVGEQHRMELRDLGLLIGRMMRVVTEAEHIPIMPPAWLALDDETVEGSVINSVRTKGLFCSSSLILKIRVLLNLTFHFRLSNIHLQRISP